MDAARLRFQNLFKFPFTILKKCGTIKATAECSAGFSTCEVFFMWLKELKKYIGLLLVGIALIAVYKTFDNFGILLDWGRNILSLLTPFFIGFGIAYVLFIPCRKIEVLCQKTKIAFLNKHRRSLAIASIYLIFLAVVTLMMFAIIPALIESISELIDQLPSLIQGFFNWINSFGIYEFGSGSLETFLNKNLLSVDKLLNGFTFDNVNRYAKGVMNFGTALFNAFMGVIISIYILVDRHNMKKICNRIIQSYISEEHRSFLGQYVRKINEFIHLYISCQLLDAVIIFILSFIALAILQTKYALLLALIVGTFNLIPYFGAITATILAGLVTAFTNSFTAGLIVVAVLIVLQQLDANFIQPKLLSGSLNVRPFWVIFGIILGGGLFGFLGIFLAVPIIALLRIIALDILENREQKKQGPQKGTVRIPVFKAEDSSPAKDEK